MSCLLTFVFADGTNLGPQIRAEEFSHTILHRGKRGGGAGGGGGGGLIKQQPLVVAGRHLPPRAQPVKPGEL